MEQKMKISPSTPLFFLSYKKQNTINKQQENTNGSNPIAESNLFAYKDYNISFGARLNRTPEDFYAQKFNQDNMPDTVRKYLMEDFEERHHMPPAQLQREAFEYIGIADTVQDVKDMYPDEPLFEDLRPFSETKAKRGTLFLLRWNAQMDNTPIFRDTRKYKDLTMYLLKKVYLEGKTLEEINKDFESDSTYRIKKDLGITDGKYFTYSDLKSLGVKYPKLPYYQSFLATRNDKEYIPRKRSESAQTDNTDDTNAIRPKRELSQETLEKMSIAKKKWWASLSEEQRSEQIKRMIEGKELSDSVYAKYQGQIMTIAAGKIGFSEKLSKIYAERYADDEFMQDFSSYAEAQRAVMEEFWNKDSSFRKYYSKNLKQIIEEFEDAYYNNNTQKLEYLLNLALEQKNKVINKANEKRQQKTKYQQKLEQEQQPEPVQPKQPEEAKETQTTQKAEPVPDVPVEPKPETEKDIIRAFKKQEAKSLQRFTDIFAAEFLEYIMKNTDTATKRYSIGINRDDAKEYLNLSSDKELSEIIEQIKETSEEINQNFNITHSLTAKTNDFVINNFIYEFTGNPLIFKYERGDISSLLDEAPILLPKVMENKDLLNKQMKLLNTPMSEKAAAEFFDNVFFPKFIKLLDNGFKYYPQMQEEQCNTTKKMITIAYRTNPIQIKNSSKYIGNYNAAIKFLKDPQKDEAAKEVIFEHMAVDFILWLFKYDSLKENGAEKISIAPKINKAKPAAKAENKKFEGSIDFNSIDSLRKTFRDFAKVQNAFFSKSFSNLLINFNLSHPYATKELLTLFLIFETNAHEALTDMELGKEEKEELAKKTQEIFNQINIEFDEKYPQQTQANEFALNQTLYEITKDPDVFKNSRADSVMYILDNKLEDKVLAHANAIDKRYKDYSVPLNEKDIIKYLQNSFMQDVTNVYLNGMKYHTNIDNRVAKGLLSHVFAETHLNIEKEKAFMLTFLKRRKGVIKYISNPYTPENVKQLLKEHLVYDFIYERALKLKNNNVKS